MQLCIGTVQFGMSYGIQGARQPDLSDVLEILDVAVCNGVFAIDTAAAYGTAEDILGIFINKNKEVRNKIELTSKLSPNATDDVKKEVYATAVRNSLVRSIKNMNIEYLDNYLLHNPLYLNNDAIVDALLLLKKEGLAIRVGASIYTSDEALKAIECGLDVLQIPYSVLDQRMEKHGILDLALKNNVKIYSRSAFTQGLILMDEDGIPSHLVKARPIISALNKFCEDHNITRLQLALAFVSRQSSIDYLVFGVDNKNQLMEVIEASEKAISSEILEKAKDKFANLNEEVIIPSKWEKI